VGKVGVEKLPNTAPNNLRLEGEEERVAPCFDLSSNYLKGKWGKGEKKNRKKSVIIETHSGPHQCSGSHSDLLWDEPKGGLVQKVLWGHTGEEKKAGRMSAERQ